MKTRTITLRAQAWLGKYGDPESLTGKEDDNGRAVSSLSIFQSGMDMAPMGYSLIGNVVMTVEVPDQQTLVENKVDALRAEQRKTLAEAQAKHTELESKIQKLLAISYEPEAA